MLKSSGKPQRPTNPLPKLPPLKKNLWKPERTAPSLLEVLYDADLTARFTQFLQKEIAEESIMFWQEAEAFTHHVYEQLPKDELINEAKALYEKFIETNAEFEVNLPSAVVSGIRGVLQRPEHDITPEKLLSCYRAAQIETLKLLQDYSLPRWLATVEWLPADYFLTNASDPQKPKPRPPSLASTLRDPSQSAQFKNYLKTESALSAMLLWEDIEIFYNMMPIPSVLREQGKKIFNRFLKPESPQHVQVPDKILFAAARAVFDSNEDQLTPSALIPVQDEAFQQMVPHHVKWCSRYPCWCGPPPESSNAFMHTMLQVTPAPVAKSSVEERRPTFEMTMSNTRLQQHFSNYLQALGLLAFLEFARDLEPLTKYFETAQAQKLVEMYVGLNGTPPEKSLPLPGSIRRELQQLLTSGDADAAAKQKVTSRTHRWVVKQLQDRYHEFWLQTGVWKTVCSVVDTTL
eukprot:TRINITY_DN4940_c0_g1_i1.p1 TRINITY_DN4940_c0_g1~~TRINITY_DN4940_c0_g1_i1.p1  ORF type:complete len:504 (-),score=157.41 TRINITY_DN4940_c0_g1_i1:32-1414(-)